IERDRSSTRPRRGQRAHRSGRFVRVARGDDDCRAGRGEALGHAEPDPAIAAGDDRDATFKIEHGGHRFASPGGIVPPFQPRLLPWLQPGGVEAPRQPFFLPWLKPPGIPVAVTLPGAAIAVALRPETPPFLATAGGA